MSTRFARGLVVGKFCPLHRGHELLIETAQSRCGELLLISYTKPEFPRCEPAVRERWLAERFPRTRRLVIDDERLAGRCAERGIAPRTVPHNDAPDGEHREFCGWLCDGVLGVTVDAVFTSEDYGAGFAAALGERFGHRVEHVAVDPARAVVPVSGTQLRADPHTHRAWLAPAVYAHFVERICILGGESSGKTTLAMRLAAELCTSLAPEYGREFWDSRRGELHFEDLLHIAQTQIAREDSLARTAVRWLVCDTSPLTTLGYSLWMFDHADPRLVALAERRYAQVFLCAGDFDFQQDGTRRDAAFRTLQHAWYEQELARRGVAWRALEGSLDERLQQALAGLLLT